MQILQLSGFNAPPGGRQAAQLRRRAADASLLLPPPPTDAELMARAMSPEALALKARTPMFMPPSPIRMN